ncbi:acyl-CoA dehydrogenase family protein [Trujillonella humicola]|uniref:acyl-CoA dehydrogenase family protein n=1 Tax=Trujillonella humicola TaxID=3383699 RepID=UPI0039063C8D
MDLLPSPDQLELVAAARQFFAEQVPPAVIRLRRDDPAVLDPATWLAGAELGLLGISLPEDVGGSGLGLDDEVLVFREIGRGLVPGPFLPTALGARLAVLAGSLDLAHRMVEGSAAVALGELRDGSVGPTALAGRLDVFDPSGAAFVLVIGEQGAGLVDVAALGELTPLPSIDPGTRLASAVVDSAPVLCWLPADEEPLRLRALVLVSAVLVGIAEAVRDQSSEHAKTRVQFGRPIGVNQAIKHRCADMAVAAEAALSQTAFGAVALDSGRADREFQVLAAKIVAARAAIDGAAANIQIHGGMGFTYEHDAHLYLKRAHVLDLLFGRPADHLAALLQQEPAQ